MAITSHALTGITQAGQSLDKWQAAEQAMRIRAFIRSLRFLPLLKKSRRTSCGIKQRKTPSTIPLMNTAVHLADSFPV